MKKNTVTVLLISSLVGLTACSAGSGLDVVGKQSTASFETVLNTIPQQVAADVAAGGWALSAPDGSARFVWSADYAKTPDNDVMLEVDAAPFIAAGLDTSQLPKTHLATADKLIIGAKLGGNASADAANGAATPVAAYQQIVTNHRDVINYHTTLDHFGVKLGGGNMFEWAKDLSTNGYDESNQDKDIVFVLNPEPFIAAGVNPESVEGWAYAQVPIEENGKTEQVWKLLKPFDVK